MDKEYDTWNIIKKEINDKQMNKTFFYEREVWWCSLGVNIGVESDGKNNHFERPVVIIKKFNGNMIWIVPLTSKQKQDPYHIQITHEKGISWASISQLKTISTKRLLRKIGMVQEGEFFEIVKRITSYITIGPHISVGSSEAEATNTSIVSE